MWQQLPYCGNPPSPGELLSRFNLDPVLITALIAIAVAHLALIRFRSSRTRAVLGWLIAAAALISPLCALSVSLFSARIAQHMILLLVAAPLIAASIPVRSSSTRGSGMLLTASGAFFIALWSWHMPVPYDATFSSTPLYWLMHVTLFGSGVLLWRELIHHHISRTGQTLVAGIFASMQMGLLGAVLSLASHPLFSWHLTRTAMWGLTPLQDQQLGGVFMWVPGIALFLWVAIRSLRRMHRALEEPDAA